MCNFISKNQKLFDELDRVIDVLPEIDESALIFTLKEAQGILDTFLEKFNFILQKD